jgi:hypothetical protein
MKKRPKSANSLSQKAEKNLGFKIGNAPPPSDMEKRRLQSGKTHKKSNRDLGNLQFFLEDSNFKRSHQFEQIEESSGLNHREVTSGKMIFTSSSQNFDNTRSLSTNHQQEQGNRSTINRANNSNRQTMIRKTLIGSGARCNSEIGCPSALKTLHNTSEKMRQDIANLSFKDMPSWTSMTITDIYPHSRE